MKGINKRLTSFGFKVLKLKTVYDEVPVIPNNKEAPNKKNPEANAPSIKYLRPASDDFKESFLVEARTYNAKDCNSKPR